MKSLDIVMISKKLKPSLMSYDIGMIEVKFKTFIHGTNIEDKELTLQISSALWDVDLDSNEFNRRIIDELLKTIKYEFKISSIVFEK